MVNIRDNLTLKACRIIADIDAKDLASEVGVTVDTIYKWEKGKSTPKAPQMVKIINCFAQKGYYVDVNDINFFWAINTIKRNWGEFMQRKAYLTWNEVPALLDLEQASVLLGLSVESVRRYCVTKDLPAIQIGKQWRIDKQKLMKQFGYM